MLDEAAVSYQVVLTKADKIKPHELEQVVGRRPGHSASTRLRFRSMIVTSSEKALGVGELRAAIAGIVAERELSARGGSLVDEVREDLHSRRRRRPRRTSRSGRRQRRRRPQPKPRANDRP